MFGTLFWQEFNHLAVKMQAPQTSLDLEIDMKFRILKPQGEGYLRHLSHIGIEIHISDQIQETDNGRLIAFKSRRSDSL